MENWNNLIDGFTHKIVFPNNTKKNSPYVEDAEAKALKKREQLRQQIRQHETREQMLAIGALSSWKESKAAQRLKSKRT